MLMTKIKKQSSLLEYYEYLLVALSVMLSKSLYYATYGQNVLILVFLALLIIYIVFRLYSRTIYLTKPGLILFGAIIGSILINPNYSSSTFLVFLVILTSALLFTYAIPYDRFAQVFFNVTKILMIMSLMRYFPLFLNIESVLPDFISTIGKHYQNFIVFSIWDEGGIFLSKLRNNGLWWEPGAFQVIVNLAFIHGLVVKNIKPREYLLFSITILTMASTAGIAIFLALSIVYFGRRKRIKILLISVFILLMSVSSTEYYTVAIKSKTSLENLSTRSRYNDANLAFQIFLDHPVIGSGFGNVELRREYMRTHDFGTGSNGILLLFANLGLLALIIIVPLLFSVQYWRFNTINRTIFAMAIVLIFFTQNFTLSIIFCLLVFYGVAPRKNMPIAMMNSAERSHNISSL